MINADRVREVQPLLSLMRDIGSAHGGKTPGQVGCDPMLWRYVFYLMVVGILLCLIRGGPSMAATYQV